MSEQSGSLAKLQSDFATDPEMMELVEMFVAEMPDRLKSLQDSWNDGKYDELKRFAHQLKGASAGYGFGVIGAAAAKVEATLKAAPSPDPQTLESLKTQFDELVTLCRRAAA